MNVRDALKQLQSEQGFWGVWVVGSAEEVYRSESGGVLVSVKGFDRDLTESEFLAEFASNDFALPRTLKKASS